MKIAISGASGYIGRHLALYFSKQQHEVVTLERHMFLPEAFLNLVHKIEGCDIIVNLAGASIDKRWTKTHKQEMYNSRVLVTRQLVRAIQSMKTTPQLFISASAVGYYSSIGCHDEDSKMQGTGFLADLCYDWEQEARQCPANVRVAIMRFGIALSKEGGALHKMLRPLKLTRFSIVIGDGSQPFPWIALEDLCRAIDFITDHRQLNGVINATAPHCITQALLAHTLARSYGAWGIVSIPKFIFRLIYGEGASSLSDGQTAYPIKLLDAGFRYNCPTISQVIQ